MAKKKSNHITISGTKINAPLKYLDILKLKYYPENPRVKSALTKYDKKGINQEVIEKEMWNLDSTKDLYQDIKANRGLIEPIIVKENYVLEGNSRLCAYRYLYKNAKREEEKDFWRFISSRVLPKDVSEKLIFVLLGKLHVKGKTQWRTFEQAAYVYKMSKELKIPPKKIAEEIGIPESDAKNFIKSYETMVKGKIKDLNKFSYFFEFHKSRKIEKHLKKDRKLIGKFTKWVKEDKIPKAKDVRELPDILDDKKAKNNFEKGKLDFDEALDLSYTRHPEKGEVFYKNLKKATIALKNARIGEIREEIGKDHRLKIIKELVREIKKFCKVLKIKF